MGALAGSEGDEWQEEEARRSAAAVLVLETVGHGGLVVGIAAIVAGGYCLQCHQPDLPYGVVAGIRQAASLPFCQTA